MQVRKTNARSKRECVHMQNVLPFACTCKMFYHLRAHAKFLDFACVDIPFFAEGIKLVHFFKKSFYSFGTVFLVCAVRLGCFRRFWGLGWSVVFFCRFWARVRLAGSWLADGGEVGVWRVFRSGGGGAGMASGCIFARLGAGLGSSPSSSSEKSICFGGAVAFASGGGVTAAISFSRFR